MTTNIPGSPNSVAQLAQDLEGLVSPLTGLRTELSIDHRCLFHTE
jgi:hypothetical protein